MLLCELTLDNNGVSLQVQATMGLTPVQVGAGSRDLGGRLTLTFYDDVYRKYTHLYVELRSVGQLILHYLCRGGGLTLSEFSFPFSVFLNSFVWIFVGCLFVLVQ